MAIDFGILRSARPGESMAVLNPERMLRSLFIECPLAMAVSRRRDGVVLDVNAQWERLTGHKRQDAVGRTAAELGFWADDKARSAVFANIPEGGALPQMELSYRTPAGELRDILVDFSPLVIDGEPCMIVHHMDMTPQRSAERALRVANEQMYHQLELFQGMESLARVGHWVARDDGKTPFWSNGLYAIADMPAGSVGDLATSRSGLVESDRARFQEARDKADGSIVEYRWQQPKGAIRWMRSRIRRQMTASGEPIVLGVVQDVTAERSVTEALQEKLVFIQTIAERTPGLVFQARRRRGIGFEFLFVSDAVKDFYQVSPEHFIAHADDLIQRHHSEDLPEMLRAFKVSGLTLSPWSQEFRLQRNGGEIRWMLGDATPEPEADGSIVWTGYVADITQRKKAEAEVERLAFFDPLTNLPNRRLLLDRLKHALAVNDRENTAGALLFIDLDNFKDLNDTRGHDVGDILLQQVARRLEECVREVDTVARFGGDEFVVMLDRINAEPTKVLTHVENVARKIQVSLNRPYLIQAHEHFSSPSIGIAVFQDQTVSVEELLKRADLAMYQSKAAGRNTLRFFDPDMQAVVARRAAMESELRTGIGRNELLLHYQPVVNERGVVVGAEALVRWASPLRGLVSPADFIPLAEDTGLIFPLGQWVLRQACMQLVAWSHHAGTAELTLSVNVSARQFRQPEFASEILAILQSTGARAARLKLEITESLLLSDIDDAIRKMSELRVAGVRFALDDFGTGYSSLAYLKRLPLEQLKIDQSFVRDVLTDPNDAVIAQTVLALGHSLGLTVVAEGVETQGQRNFLLHHGCKVFQGYLFGRPVPVEDLQLNGVMT